MRLQLGNYYHTKSGRKVKIIAKKEIPASNGRNWIGETQKGGVILFYDDVGRHGFDTNYDLELKVIHFSPVSNGTPVGAYVTWLPAAAIGSIPEDCQGFLMRINNDDRTTTFITKEYYLKNYA